MKSENVIKCPVCEREYLPSEIYMPNHFLGKPNEIFKTHDGQLDYFDGIPQDLTEKFTCEHCNTKFIVTAKITYETVKNINESFDEDYSTPLYKDRISLKEV